MNHTFIIAEVGPNHNGSLERAMEYVDLLSRMKVNAVKFQLADPYKVYSKDAFKAEYQKRYDDSDNPLKMSIKYQLSREDHVKLAKKCAEKDLEYLCTAFDLESLIFLNEELNISRFKIASGEIFSVDLLNYISNFDKPVLLSTGMAKIDQIKNTIDYLNQNSRKNITLLHCISSYPAELSAVNMNYMLTLNKTLGIQVGFCVHTIGGISSIVAVAMGASVVEKHVTIDKNLPGPDHQASATIEEFAELVKSIRLVETIKGSHEKDFSVQELDVHKTALKSIVSNVDLNPGHVITENDLCFKRPGTGVSPMKIHFLLGKKVRNRVEKDRLVRLEDLYED
jgi:N,N'-diacetyllegionaminate synthase